MWCRKSVARYCKRSSMTIDRSWPRFSILPPCGIFVSRQTYGCWRKYPLCMGRLSYLTVSPVLYISKVNSICYFLFSSGRSSITLCICASTVSRNADSIWVGFECDLCWLVIVLTSHDWGIQCRGLCYPMPFRCYVEARFWYLQENMETWEFST